MTNPLLQDWTTPFQIAPFDAISDDDFDPAFAAMLAAHRAEIDAIAQNPDAPGFANTIEALEAAGQTLDKVLPVFIKLAGQFNKVPRHRCARYTFVRHIRQHLVQRVTKFVEQCARIIIR